MLRILFIFVFILLAISCKNADFLANRLQQTPHEVYSENLTEAGLDNSELGRRWLSTAESITDNPLAIQLPYEEIGWLAPDEIQVFAWQFSGSKGQRIVVELETPPENSGAIFVDLFTVESDKNIEHVTSLDKGKQRLDQVVESDANYLLRLQPELLAGGRYELRITTEPSLTFPVAGKDFNSVGSLFGDPRDGGHREHHGVDIFAPRGTRAIAAADGIVFRTGTTPRGGNVVWLTDSDLSQTYYYAHLDEITVRQGTRVNAGDALGSVGNTGNAKFTPPHLHFGIYESLGGPTDPLPFIKRSEGLPAQTQVRDNELQGILGVTANRLRMRKSPGTDASILAELKQHTIVRAAAKTGSWYRVVLANGLQGYVSAKYIDTIERPVEEIRLSESQFVRVKPIESAPEVGRLETGEKVEMYGQFGDFQYVKLSSGRFGWIDTGQG